MTTIYQADTCAPPVSVPNNLHDQLLTMLLAKAIPYLEYVEYGTRTNLELRNLIKQAKAVTKESA